MKNLTPILTLNIISEIIDSELSQGIYSFDYSLSVLTIVIDDIINDNELDSFCYECEKRKIFPRISRNYGEETTIFNIEF